MNNDDRERRNEDISKRYIQTQVEKTGTNKISAVFPEKRTNESLWVNFNFKIL